MWDKNEGSESEGAKVKTGGKELGRKWYGKDKGRMRKKKSGSRRVQGESAPARWLVLTAGQNFYICCNEQTRDHKRWLRT